MGNVNTPAMGEIFTVHYTDTPYISAAIIPSVTAALITPNNIFQIVESIKSPMREAAQTALNNIMGDPAKYRVDQMGNIYILAKDKTPLLQISQTQNTLLKENLFITLAF